MCGIVGYAGPKNGPTIVFDGLKKLEYRGYDSAGIASVVSPELKGENDKLDIRRAEGKLVNLEAKLKETPLLGQLAIGHTRWATHGSPTERNAHPHADESSNIAVVQNGIVENFIALRSQLQREGHEFKSDTDTEVITHLVDKFLAEGNDLVNACRLAFAQLEGAHAIAVISKQEPDRIVTVRLGNAGGVIVGLGQGENYLASDIPAILEHTQRMVFLEDGEMAVITADEVQYYSQLDGTPITKKATVISWDPVSAAKGQYRHFMQKEIYEQPQSIQSTIRGRVDFTTGQVTLEELTLTPAEAKAINKIVIVACGTSAYAGQVGKFIIEKLARVNVSVDYASEFRYRDPLLDDKTVVLAITQSGETVDTLAAMEEGRSKGAKLWSIVNVQGSMAHRISNGAILMQAGPEIGVASTKAFTTTLTDLVMLGMYLGQLRGTLSDEESYRLAAELAHLPEVAGEVLANGNDYDGLASLYHNRGNFLFLGRGFNYPIALEGALKLKEISYIHAEGYPAGEMKHGPIALIDDNMPVVCIVTQDHVYDKMISQIEQVRARNGIIISLINEGDEEVARKSDHVLTIPKVNPLLTPIISVIPLQLLAYHMAVWRGADVDQPRNLAKSVTVE